MRNRLLDATVSSLAAVGWSGTTLPAVVARAGVARGAQVHHFPTKALLIAATGDHLLERHVAEFTEAFEALPVDQRTIATALDSLWEIFQGPTWSAVIELGIAGRTDPTIATALDGFTERVDLEILTVVARYFPQIGESPLGPTLVRTAVALLTGLALRSTLAGDHKGHQEEVFSYLKLLASALAPDPAPLTAVPVDDPPTEELS